MTISDFINWTKKPKISIGKVKILNFTIDSTKIFVEYNDADNDFVLSKGLFLEEHNRKDQSILYKFIDDYKKRIGVSKSGCSDDIQLYKQPLLVKIPLKKIKEDVSYSDKRRIEGNLKTFFSFLNNSSIWVRVVDNDDDENKVIEEFQAIAKMELYKYDSAKENFGFNCRIQLENRLEGAHGHDVTPILYGNESEFYKKLFE